MEFKHYKINTEGKKYKLCIVGNSGQTLLAIDQDDNFVGEIENMGEAAQVFMKSIRNQPLEVAKIEPAKEETFFDRLVRERDELKDKVEKLASFLSDDEKATKISGKFQVSFLHRQLFYMNHYLGILNERIDHLETTVPSN